MVTSDQRLIVECLECLTGYIEPTELATSDVVRMEETESRSRPHERLRGRAGRSACALRGRPHVGIPERQRHGRAGESAALDDHDHGAMRFVAELPNVEGVMAVVVIPLPDPLDLAKEPLETGPCVQMGMPQVDVHDENVRSAQGFARLAGLEGFQSSPTPDGSSVVRPSAASKRVAHREPLARTKVGTGLLAHARVGRFSHALSINPDPRWRPDIADPLTWFRDACARSSTGVTDHPGRADVPAL